MSMMIGCIEDDAHTVFQALHRKRLYLCLELYTLGDGSMSHEVKERAVYPGPTHAVAGMEMES